MLGHSREGNEKHTQSRYILGILRQIKMTTQEMHVLLLFSSQIYRYMINGDRLIIGKYLMQKLFSVPRIFYIRGSILRQIKKGTKKGARALLYF